jgi:hypothetical protein
MSNVQVIYAAEVHIWHTITWFKGTKIVNERLLADCTLFETQLIMLNMSPVHSPGSRRNFFISRTKFYRSRGWRQKEKAPVSEDEFKTSKLYQDIRKYTTHEVNKTNLRQT